MSEVGKQRVVVLFGGQSAEHDVSCTSAVAVLRALDPSRYEVLPIGVTTSGQWVRSASALELLARVASGTTDAGALPRRVEVAGPAISSAEALPVLAGVDGAVDLPVVFPVIHGPFGEDGTVQGMLELAGVPYVGSGVLSSAVSMDKGVARELVRAAGLPLASWHTRAAWEIDSPASRASFAELVASTLGWPAFVKPANLGSSVGVSKAHDAEEFAAAVDLALVYDDHVVVEETILGREIEFAVLGNERPEVSVAGEIRPGNEFYDYEDKYLDDNARLLIPAPLSADEQAEGQRIALATYRALRCEGMARIDLFYDDGSTGGPGRGWFVNEANTIPGFTPISQYPKLWEASGLPYPQLVDRLIALAIARHARRSGRVGRTR